MLAPSASKNYIKLYYGIQQLIHLATPCHLELDVTPLAGPAGALDLQHCLSVGVLDGEPRVDEGAVLLHPADGSADGRLDLHLLQAAETAPVLATVGADKVDHLTTEGGRGEGGSVCVCVCVCVCV